MFCVENTEGMLGFVFHYIYNHKLDNTVESIVLPKIYKTKGICVCVCVETEDLEEYRPGSRGISKPVARLHRSCFSALG